MKKILWLLIVACTVFVNTKTAAQNFKELMGKEIPRNLNQVKEKLDKYYADPSNREEEFGEEKESDYKAYQRWLRSMRGSTDANGNIINASSVVLNEYLSYQEKNPSLKLNSAGGSWINLNPASLTGSNQKKLGRVSCIAFDPGNANIIYAGTPAGGVWKTTNGGTTWNCITNGIPLLGVSSICVDFSNSSVIYILTGDGDSGYLYSTGVLKSFDGGLNWFSTALKFDATQVVRGYAITQSGIDANLLLAATSNGIYQTTDGGLNWSLKQAGWFYDVKFKPSSNTTAYATTNSDCYVTTTGGSSWTALLSTAYSPSKPSGTNRIQIGVTPVNSSVVYLLFGPGTSTPGFKGLYKSTNSGSNFTLMSNTPNILGSDCSGAAANDQSGYDLALAVSPGISTTLITGGINVWKSTNSGSTWGGNSISCYYGSNYVHEDVHVVAYNGTVMYAGTDGGLSKSTDGGVTWTYISLGIFSTQYYKISGYDPDNFLFYGGTQDNGVFKYTPGVYKDVGCCDASETLIDRTNQNNVLANGSNAFLYKSTDGYATGGVDVTPWYGCGCADATNGIFLIEGLQQDPSNSNIVYCLIRDCYKSTNFGSTWTRYVTGSNSPQADMAIAPSNSNYIYAVNGGELRRSINAGVNWSLKTTPAGASGFLGSVTVSSSDPNKIWITYQNFSAGMKVFASTDGGTTWTSGNITGSLPNVRVYCIKYQNGSSDGLYVGTDIGVFYRDNLLGDWIPFSNGLPNVFVSDLEISYAHGTITAGTFGRGIWQSDIYTGCPFFVEHNGGIGSPPNIGSEYFEASDSIHSSLLLQGGIGTDITLNSGRTIGLTVGFQVKAGTTFKGELNGCGNPLLMPALEGNYAGVLTGINANSTSDGSFQDMITLAPNPVSSQIKLSYTIANDSYINISFYDISGRKIKELKDNLERKKGSGVFDVDVSEFENGIYFCTLSAGGKDFSKKFCVIH
ncbi:MAG: T9SS type A sorting domain-containing protein [Bacteroidia bacterium]